MALSYKLRYNTTMKICNKCEKELDDDKFYISKGRLVNPCISCRLLILKKWRANNHAKVLEHKRKYNAVHADKHRADVKKWVENNKEKYEAYHKKWLAENRDKTRAYVAAYTDKVRDKILDHYGHHCNNCGISDDDVLVVDHVNNDGNAHRKKHKGKYGQYKSIIDAGYPNDYQILCCNCNWKKHVNGGTL